jgi:hypothetical protein
MLDWLRTACAGQKACIQVWCEEMPGNVPAELALEQLCIY